MRTHKLPDRCAALLLALSLLAPLAACGGNTGAATMHLTRTQGEVGVSDDAGKSVEPRENLGLYSGYGVDTRSSSYAWINLDDVKLAKMDQDTRITIEKEGKALEIEVRFGALFFNVTEPLADDETMNIRASTMLVGIRGTCGWVEIPDASHMNVYLLEGKVECTAAGKTAVVTAGETGRLDEMAGTVTVEPFTRDDIPGFVRGELDGISLDGIPEAVESDPGADASAPQPEPTQPPEPEPLPADGDRIVFTGTAGTYTYDEVLTLQGVSDPNPGYDHSGEVFRLIVLDEPQTMGLSSYADPGMLFERPVSMIAVTGLEQYGGQHLIFSIDPYQTYWPSDTSLPLGEPSTRDVHVLGPASSD